MDDKFSAKQEDLKRYFLEYGSLTAISQHYDISIAKLSLLFKQCKLSIKKLRSERIRNKILKDYNLLIQKLGHCPVSTEFLKHAETKDLYHRIIKTFGSLNGLRVTYNYSPAGKDKIENIRNLRAKEIYNAYILLGTLDKVSKKCNITRERVRQILQSGSSAGLFKYPVETPKLPTGITPEQLKKDYILYGSKIGVAKHYGISIKKLSEFTKKYDLSVEQLYRERTNIRILERYNRIMQHLGHHPTATELYQAGGRVLCNNIWRVYGSIDNFRKAYNYPLPEKTTQKFTRMRQEKSKSNRQNILDYLRTKTKAGAIEISNILRMDYEIVRMYLLKLREEGIADYTVKGRCHYYFLKNMDISGGERVPLKPEINPEDKAFIEQLSQLYIRYESMDTVAKKMQENKFSMLEKLDKIIRSKYLFPIITRKALILALRIKGFCDKHPSTYKASKKFGLHEVIINKYLRKGSQAGLFKYPVFSTKRKEYGAAPSLVQQDAYSKKNIQAILAVKKDYDISGSCEKVARTRGVSRERIRQILTMGSDLGLFEYPPKKQKLFSSITKEDLYDSFLRHKNIYKLSRLHKVSVDEIKKAMEKYGISTKAIRLELNRAETLNEYQNLLRKLGHHPSVTEIRLMHHYLLQRIKKGWGSIYEFRKSCGFPSPKLGAPEK